MLEFAAGHGRYRVVTSSAGQPLWADKAVGRPVIRSGVASLPIGQLRARFLEAIRVRADRERWPLRRPFGAAHVAELAAKMVPHVSIEVWVNRRSRGALPCLGAVPVRTCTWMPTEVALLVPSERRVGIEWDLGDGRCSLALWGPEQVGMAW